MGLFGRPHSRSEDEEISKVSNEADRSEDGHSRAANRPLITTPITDVDHDQSKTEPDGEIFKLVEKERNRPHLDQIDSSTQSYPITPSGSKRPALPSSLELQTLLIRRVGKRQISRD